MLLKHERQSQYIIPIKTYYIPDLQLTFHRANLKEQACAIYLTELNLKFK